MYSNRQDRYEARRLLALSALSDRYLAIEAHAKTPMHTDRQKIIGLILKIRRFYAVKLIGLHQREATAFVGGKRSVKSIERLVRNQRSQEPSPSLEAIQREFAITPEEEQYVLKTLEESQSTDVD